MLPNTTRPLVSTRTSSGTITVTEPKSVLTAMSAPRDDASADTIVSLLPKTDAVSGPASSTPPSTATGTSSPALPRRRASAPLPRPAVPPRRGPCVRALVQVDSAVHGQLATPADRHHAAVADGDVHRAHQRVGVDVQDRPVTGGDAHLALAHQCHPGQVDLRPGRHLHLDLAHDRAHADVRPVGQVVAAQVDDGLAHERPARTS